ncbi:ribonuclease E/G [Elizabethkingia anophelis]|uniref:Ribonuclease E/G n=4 Tax=Elizabethkingia TaxID=308865 RepID=A0AAQ3D135_ELIMR|nr:MULTISPECIES: ribonuclease E/G [Elizabethkingia]AIL45056.1 Cytoplasmic axial filament protein CafA and Ribonuclease G [Elizabethkingia anophelis NUHP1]AKH93873.1 ribonuclease G [Elizabethkingia anophelis FMS-007]AMR40064.1 ribonuclease G [Elizabethkingia anophelis]AMX46699.1 ribonuclease G [Elizabethkingia anophelis]AMX50161.1 ribonuclease G [Elizabethkingia anophelis]
MKKELIISHEDDTSKIALLEDGRLFELHQEEQNNQFVVGDLFLGKIKKLAPNLNAAFVSIGYEKDAFLHYLDLGPQILSYQKFVKDTISKKQQNSSLKNFAVQKEIPKDGTIDKVLAAGDSVLLQITKEPISTKGPRISTQISLTGRFLVLIPFDNKVSISKKIKNNQEKERLKMLIESIRPEGFGVIIRTVAEGKKVAELHNDMNQLITKWESCFKNIQKNKVPSKVLSEEDKASAILRDNFNQDFVNIICDDEQMVNDMKNYLEVIAPESKNIVQLYDSHIPLLEYYNVEKQLKQSFGKHVNIPSSKGAYLVVEHTEALHVIDVNSGNNISASQTNKLHALNVNKMAATEIARQLRLRDMGGIIVIDFIDMTDPEHRKELFEHLKEEMKRDKARHKILPPSKFGLIQITRQRVRPEKQIETKEENPNKDGEIVAPIVTVEKMEEAIRSFLTKEKGRLYLHVHPFVEAYLTKGVMSIQNKWFLRYKKWVTVIPRDSFKYLEYALYNSKKKELMSDSN